MVADGRCAAVWHRQVRGILLDGKLDGDRVTERARNLVPTQEPEAHGDHYAEDASCQFGPVPHTSPSVSFCRSSPYSKARPMVTNAKPTTIYVGSSRPASGQKPCSVDELRAT